MPRRDEITDTIRHRIVSGLHFGTLARGDRLPSTRELAVAYATTPRAVMGAYRRLAAEGLVEVRERSGMYVAAGPTSSRGLLPQLAGWVVDVLVQGLERGVPARELPERLRRCLETLRLRAACIEGNDDRLFSLCRELCDDYGIEALPVDVDRLDEESARLHLRQADLFVTTNFHAPLARRLAAAHDRPCIVVTLRPDIVGELSRRLSRGPVYFVGTDPRFADALQQLFEPMGNAHNVRTLVAGRDDLGVIPPDAPVEVMRRVRDRFPDEPVVRRATPIARMLSAESAAELLTFVVRANLAAIAAGER